MFSHTSAGNLIVSSCLFVLEVCLRRDSIPHKASIFDLGLSISDDKYVLLFCPDDLRSFRPWHAPPPPPPPPVARHIHCVLRPSFRFFGSFLFDAFALLFLLLLQVFDFLSSGLFLTLRKLLFLLLFGFLEPLPFFGCEKCVWI